MGADQPVFVRYFLWLRQFFWVEPLTLIDGWFGTTFAEGEQRILSWQSRSPVFTIIGQRMPQTLTVIGTAYLVGILIALPIGIYSAYRQYSLFDQFGTLVRDDRLFGADLLFRHPVHHHLRGLAGLVSDQI